MSNFQLSILNVRADWGGLGWLAARCSPAAFLRWVASCTWAPDANPCQTPYLICQLEKGQSMSIICQMTWNAQFSTFNLQWSGTQDILSALSQPCTTLPLHQNLHRRFKLGVCWVCQFIKQMQNLIQRQLLFLFEQGLLQIWDNNGHLAVRQCNTYIVGVVVNTGLCLSIILSPWHRVVFVFVFVLVFVYICICTFVFVYILGVVVQHWAVLADNSVSLAPSLTRRRCVWSINSRIRDWPRHAYTECPTPVFCGTTLCALGTNCIAVVQIQTMWSTILSQAEHRRLT